MKTLKIGDSGSEVKYLQELLLSYGVIVATDGQLGPKTQEAAIAFQKSRGLIPDGIVGEKSWNELEKTKGVEVAHDPEVKIVEFDDRTEKYFKTLDPKAQKIFLPFILEAKEIAAKLGYEYKAISGNRTWEEQNSLYDQWRTKPGNKVTNAKGGQSNHNFKIALDFGCFKDGKYMDEGSPREAEKVHNAVAELCVKYGLEWGGAWTLRDFPHFEIKTGLTMAQKRDLFYSKGSVL